MKKLGQGPQAKQQPSREKARWVCLVAALSFCLWGANVLPIQQVEYKLTTNLAVSQHRMPLLQRLCCDSEEIQPGKNTPFSALEIVPDDIKHSTSANSELRSVRVKIRFPNRSDLPILEQSLNELTTPSMESEECHEFAKQLQKERWLLESCVHSMKRLKLDLEREKNAIETDTVDTELIKNERAETDTFVNAAGPAPRSSAAFRLTSYGSREPSQQSQLGLMDTLRNLNQIRTENVESMVLTLERLKAKARGFLSLTGSPRVDPVVRPLTLFRFLVLCILCTSVWLLLMGWLYSFRKHFSDWQETPLFNRTVPVNYRTDCASESSSRGIKKTIHWMRREGIPYLGAIHILSEESLASRSGSQIQTQLVVSSVATEQVLSTVEDLVLSDRSRQLKSIRTLRSLSEGSLVLWIGLFAARVIFDPVWRELVAVAPLASISRMITGIQ